MGFKSSRKHLWVLFLLITIALLVGCNRSATEAEPTPEEIEGQTVEETSAQTMTTQLPAEKEPESDVEATTAAETATEQAQPAQEQPTDMPVPAEPPAAEATEEAPAEEPAEPQEQSYTVGAGDTLYSIARQYGITVEELAERNGIVNVHQIDTGQELVIPVAGVTSQVESGDAQVHVVQLGENLFRISLGYNLSFETVAAHNNIPWPYRIYPGQEIKIPPTD